MKKEWIEVAAQMGGKDAFLVMQPHVKYLKQAFASVVDPISDQVQQLTYILRVDGNVRVWNLPFVSNIDMSLKDSYISVDIAVPLHEWKKAGGDLADYISHAFREGMQQSLLVLKQAGVAIDADELARKLNDALNVYQRSVTAGLPTTHA